MKLLIVVGKPLAGFDAPSCAYIHLDHELRDHNLFQAIHRTNRLEGEDKQYGHIVDFKELFGEVREAIAVYASDELDIDDGGGGDNNIHLDNWLAEGRTRLDRAREALGYLCEPVPPPRGLERRPGARGAGAQRVLAAAWARSRGHGGVLRARQESTGTLMVETIQIGEIAIAVTRKDVRNVHLPVRPPAGRVTLVAPRATRLEAARAHAALKLGWIRDQQSKLRGQARETQRQYVERESHCLWGRRCLLSAKEEYAKPRARADHRRITLIARPGSSQEKRARIMQEWRRALLREAAHLAEPTHGERFVALLDRHYPTWR